jgi:CopG-like RHH_1 or ribbon-helix-helix domain, RHH_5
MPKLAVGHPTKDGNLRIAATLPKPVFHRVRTRAAKEGKTMSEMIATLCSIGLLDLDECDRFEPEVNPRPDVQH